MTVPTPSSPGGDRPQHDDPWAHRPPADHGPAGAAARGPAGNGAGPVDPAEPGPKGPYPPAADASARLPWGRETRDMALAAAGVALSGLVVGLLWLWLAPRVPLVSDGTAVYLKNPEGEEAIGADGTFVLLSLVVGVVAGLVVFLLRRKGGVGLAVGIALGGAAASLLAWRLGVWLGPTGDLAAHAREAGKGTVFDGPLELRAKGALLALPFAAVASHLVCTGVFAQADPPPPVPHDW